MTGAICLTYDDLFVSGWLAARPIFAEFGARVTFCVSHLHTANSRQIDGLHTLQEDGHEIAFHTRTHPKFKRYIAQFGLDHWLEHEIDQGVAEHRALGFPAASFASPFHASTRESRAACAERFAVVRAKGPHSVPRRNLHRRIYQKPTQDKVVNNLGFADMQSKAFPGWAWQMHLLDVIADLQGTGVFTGHNIRYRKSEGNMHSSHRQLRRLLMAAQARGLAFKTLSDLAKV